MKFGISMELDSDAERNARAVQKFATLLSHSLDHDYGADLQNFTVGIICIKSRPGYEEWYKQRGPRFRPRQPVRMLDGTSLDLANAFSYDIRLTDDEYETFVSASPRDAAELISRKLYQSLSNLDALPPKVKDFDRGRFETDVERYSAAALAGL